MEIKTIALAVKTLVGPVDNPNARLESNVPIMPPNTPAPERSAATAKMAVL